MIWGELTNPHRHRELILQLALRDIRARRKQSVVGLAWLVIQPLAQTAVLALVFSQLIRVETGQSAAQYPLFIFSGLLVWRLMTTIVSGSVANMIGQAALISRTRFPRDAPVYATVLSALIDLAVNIAILAALVAVYRLLGYAVPLDGRVLWIFPALAIALVLAVGVALAAAALNVLWRDVGIGLSLALQLWFYATPVIYPQSLVPGWLMPWYRLNPMAAAAEAARAALLPVAPPDLASLATGAAVAGAVLLAGLAVFKKCEPFFPDFL